MLTEKQNYMMTLRGECPEWVPTYTLGVDRNNPTKAPSALFEPSPLVEHRINGGGLDMWGVNYIPTYETGGALLPEPNNFILKDIRQWRDVIKAPDVSSFDWEAIAKADFERSGIDREHTAVAFGLHFGYFQTLMSFMGFTDGLVAMFEEPEEVRALLTYLCDFYCSVAEACIDYYQPDIFTMMDDTAAWASPFISMEMYKDLLMPLYDRQAKFGRDRGIPITFHNCGKCMDFMEELHKIGVTSWDPAQVCNDLDAFKAKYGNSYVITGGWSAQGRLLEDDVTDEEIYESVRASINRLAPGGGYVFSGGFLGPIDDEKVRHKNAVVRKAVYEIGHSFYK